jgi:hypothetical protein
MPRPCRSSAMPLRKRLPKATAQRGMGAAGERHGMCELTSAVSRRPVGDLPTFGFFRLTGGVSRSLLDDDVGSRLAVRIFPAATRTFTKETAGQGRSTACVN